MDTSVNHEGSSAAFTRSSFMMMDASAVQHAPDSKSQNESARSWNASVSQPPYVPQFSAATSLILNRMKGGTQSLNSALSDMSAKIARPNKDAYEDAKNRLVQSMNTTLTVPVPQQSPFNQIFLEKTTKTNTSSTDAHSLGIKRKREFELEAFDVTQNTVAFPNLPPPTAPQVTSLPPSGGSLNLSLIYEHPEDLPRKQKIERIRRKRLASLPDGVSPAKPDLVGFGPGAASDHVRTEYFQSMNKIDLLNLLSFSDQLKPQLLVDIMVSVSKRHPDLPIFNSPDWDASIADRPAPKMRRGPGRPPHGRSLLNSKAKQKIKGSSILKYPVKKPLKRSRLAEETFAGDMPGEEDEDALPPTWPKSGQGLYAKLVPEFEDRLFLADDNDEEAFSQFMVNRAGKQIIDPV